MTKPYPRMICAICRRPLLRASALKGGLPVGRVCAESAGLVQRKARKPSVASAETAQARDTHTMNLFDQHP